MVIEEKRLFMKENVLILAPHTDDGEFGCGGTMARLLEEGHEIFYVAFSICRDSVPKGEREDILDIELHKAMSVFGIDNEHTIVLDYPVREFTKHRQDILDDMLRITKRVSPQKIFAPSIQDIHQDHHVIAEEAMRAFKKVTLYAYEVPWNNFTFSNQAYFKLEKRHVEIKRRAIECYETQKHKPYASEEFTYGQMKVHGVQVECEYAEVFEVVRAIL